jgi:hypothetical protein
VQNRTSWHLGGSLGERILRGLLEPACEGVKITSALVCLELRPTDNHLETGVATDLRAQHAGSSCARAMDQARPVEPDEDLTKSV